MESNFTTIVPEQISDNVFKLFNKDWTLITAGNLQNYNTMTASWGGFGILWNKRICFCVVRPQRHTFKFIDKSDTFTLSFFEEQYRDMLNFCGTKSGKDVDKAAATGITPVEDIPGMVYFNEARLVIECRKLYYDDIKPENFVDSKIDSFYPDKDYHRMYVGEIVKCYIKK